MNNFSFKVFILLLLVFSFFATDFVYAGYQKIAPGDTVTLGEFVFDDDFVATTTPCTIGITNPSNVVVVPSTTAMTANNDGWHYYNYTATSGAVSGIWPSVMICGSVIAGDLVKVDKSFIIDSSMVTKSYINTATSTLIAEIAKGWTVTLSDFGATTVNTAYKAKLQILNYATVPTDADYLPTVVITDSAGTVQVSAGVMTKDSNSNGSYSYSYSITSGVGGVWETVVTTTINGQIVKRVDYWNLSSSPADVTITNISDKVIPTITANVKIDNKGTAGSDFYYVYCIVSSADNLCGGNDDVDSGSATIYIDAGSFENLTLTLDDVPTAGTYWFKVKARALAEPNWAAATEQFIAESGTITPPVTPPGGGGTVGGGAPPPVVSPTPTPPAAVACKGADLNFDNKVNSTDFSILLYFWKTSAPFSNSCVDINKDRSVNSVDFSIMLYQWGGSGINITMINQERALLARRVLWYSKRS
ncbi:MAG: dockerin type I domain-containing protein [Patescibacteria group bacterium]